MFRLVRALQSGALWRQWSSGLQSEQKKKKKKDFYLWEFEIVVAALRKGKFAGFNIPAELAQSSDGGGWARGH